MKKFTKIIAAAVATLLTLGAAGCNKTSGDNGGNNGSSLSHPSFINPSEGGGDQPASEKYIVNVLSVGGTKLDGVQIALKRGDTVVRRGISRNGKIEFGVTLGDYELEIDESTLPAGYYLEGDESYRTNPDSREEVNIRIPSKLISASGSVDSYAPGNIMRDFTFTDVDGASHSLSKLLETKKAVVLNFFFTTCNPCRAEFPHLQTAYAERKANANDIEVLGICTTSMGDNDQTVAAIKLEMGLTFPVGVDRLGLCQAFGISNYPTTIVIDRYGMIAARESGGQPSTPYWRQMFSNFASSNYVQNVIKGDNDDPDKPGNGEMIKPDVDMPSSLELEQAALSEHTTATFTADEDEFSWPWLVGSDAEGSYIYSSNTGKNNSYAIVHANVEMKKDELLSFEYNISSEVQADYLYVLLDGMPMNTGYSGGNGKWNEVNLYVADRDKTVDLAFAYQKDAADPDTGVGDDVAKIRNISVVPANNETVTNSLDVMRECASGAVVGNRYEHYVNAVYSDPEEGGDGFYHKDTKDGPLIYMTINQISQWSELHGKTMTSEDGTTYDSTIFRITEDKYLVINRDDEVNNVTVNIGGKDVSEAYTEYVLIMSYMPAPYYLIPVTEPLKEWADALVADYEKGAQHANEWLEFCYYYDHYGPQHDEEGGDGDTCKVDIDYTMGLTRYNAYTAYSNVDLNGMSTDEKGALNENSYNKETGRNKAFINFPLQLIHNGSYYKFKAGDAGVYQIRSYTEGCSPTTESTGTNNSTFVVPMPKILVYNKDGSYLTMNEGYSNDFDGYTGEVVYEGFNMYLTLNAGQEIYLYLATNSATRSYYDFDITYRGESYEKMMICSTAGGAWTYIPLSDGSTMYTYLGIDVMYDESEDRYYAVKNGQPDHEQPVYIDMIYNSFFMEEILNVDYAFKTLEFMIKDGAFRKYMYNGIDYEHPKMQEYLGEALSKDKNDPLYGLIPANGEIVSILNAFIERNAGGMGEGNGWLAFAVYNAKMGG